MIEPKLPLSGRARKLRTIYASFSVAIFVYTLVLVFNREQPGAAGNVDVLQPALSLAALMFGGASIWWRRRITRLTQLIPPEQLANEDSFVRLQTNCIITWALSESVAVMGLMIALLRHDLNAFLPYGMCALALLAVHRPSAWPQWHVACASEVGEPVQAN